MGIPQEQSRIGVPVNHADICKFEEEGSQAFQNVFKQLRALVIDACEEPQRQVADEGSSEEAAEGR